MSLNVFSKSEISFLGYLVCSQIIKPTFKKVKLTFDYFFIIEFESKSINISIERLKSTFLPKEPDFVPLYQRWSPSSIKTFPFRHHKQYKKLWRFILLQRKEFNVCRRWRGSIVAISILDLPSLKIPTLSSQIFTLSFHTHDKFIFLVHMFYSQISYKNQYFFEYHFLAIQILFTQYIYIIFLFT